MTEDTLQNTDKTLNDDNSNVVWNVPNVLSSIRLLMSFFVFGFIVFQFYLVALVLFVIAAGTDWIDGWWAFQ